VLAPVVGSVIARDSRRAEPSRRASAPTLLIIASSCFALLRFARFVRFGSMKA
jgi:hypothetical protein